MKSIIAIVLMFAFVGCAHAQAAKKPAAIHKSTAPAHHVIVKGTSIHKVAAKKPTAKKPAKK